MANITTVPSTLASTTIPDLPIILPANLARSAYNLLALYTGFLTFVGIFNNGLVIFLFLKFQNLRQPVNYFLLNLSISDMTVSLLASPLTFASNIAGYWLFGQLGCSVYAFVVMIGGKLFYITFLIVRLWLSFHLVSLLLYVYLPVCISVCPHLYPFCMPVCSYLRCLSSNRRCSSIVKLEIH